MQVAIFVPNLIHGSGNDKDEFRRVSLKFLAIGAIIDRPA